MKEPAICLYVQADVDHPLRWILQDFNKHFHITSCHSPGIFERMFKSQEWGLLVLDYDLFGQAIASRLTEIKNGKPDLKVILIVPPVGTKEVVLEIIKTKLVSGLVVKPFTGEVVCKYIEKDFSTDADAGLQKFRT